MLISAEYRTWDENDLKKVNLGGKKNDYAYSRYLIKAAWNLMAHNTPLNDEKMKHADGALHNFQVGAFSTIILVFLVVLTNGLVGRKVSNLNNLDTAKTKAESMTGKLNNGSQNMTANESKLGSQNAQTEGTPLYPKAQTVQPPAQGLRPQPTPHAGLGKMFKNSNDPSRPKKP